MQVLLGEMKKQQINEEQKERENGNGKINDKGIFRKDV